MKRLLIFAALVVAALAVVTGAVAAGSKTALIFDSADNNGPPSNLPSYGAEAYGFAQIGDEVTFAGTNRKLSNVVVTLSSWACVTGHWYSGDCVTPDNAKYALPLTLNIYDETNTGVLLASSTQTFNVSYRPSASAKCVGASAGKWYSSALKTCFNGSAQNVTFTNFTGNTILPDTVVYGVTYNTTHYGSNPIGEGAACFTGPGGCFYDSLNVAVTPNDPSVGTVRGTAFGTAAGVFTTVDPDYTPAVQFKAGS
jgi:hypothetical protein